MRFPQPDYRYRFKLRDGTTILANPRDVVKTLDKLNPALPPERVFEVMHNGVVRKLWEHDLIEWDQEALPG
jgi:hypothetical protein